MVVAVMQSWWLWCSGSSYACYEVRCSVRIDIHGGYGVAVAQRLVEPLVRVQLPIVTQGFTEKEIYYIVYSLINVIRGESKVVHLCTIYTSLYYYV